LCASPPGCLLIRVRQSGGTVHLSEARLRIMPRLLLRSLLFALAAPAMFGSVFAQSPAPSADQVVLAPGDSVRIVVWRKPEMSGDFIVAPDGTISQPLYRAVRVGGVPFPTAEINIRNFLAKFEQDPQFVVEPLVRVAVSGEVGKPQVFAVRPETSIAEAVAQAGGPSENAKRDQVRVLRKDANGHQREFYVNLFDPVGSSATVRVHSGDQIVLDRKKSFFREVFMPALSVVGSIASIGLLIDRASRKN
jgi:polysaccharide biosynthesis/export protein